MLPTPTHHVQAADYFGNPTNYITLQHRHKELILHAKSVIEVTPTGEPRSAAKRPVGPDLPAALP